MEKLIWYPKRGESVDLTDLVNYRALRGRIGHMMPAFKFSTSTVPLQDGVKVRGVRADARTVDIPLLVMASDRSALTSVLRDMASKLNPALGEGSLRSVDADGEGRELRCYYKGGFERGDEGPMWYKTVISFLAGDPWWYEINARTATVDTGAVLVKWFPMPPLRLMSSTVYGIMTVRNPGSVDAWPVWSITGPGEDPVLQNTTSGKTLSLDVTLNAGDVLTVDTRPRVKAVQLNGISHFEYASGNLWQLQTGNNQVQVDMAGSTVASEVLLEFYAGYETP